MCVLAVPDRDIQDKPFSYRSIYESYLKCRKNKRNSINALRFEINAEENILKLERELNNRTYRPSRSILFAAHKPKTREIFAADFRDRIVHHLLISRMEKIWERIFIHDSYACRNGKGTHMAVMRLKSFLSRITRNGNVRTYYLQLDIKDFFISINKRVLYDLIRPRMSDPDLIWLAEQTVFWDCTVGHIQRGESQLLLNIPENKSLFGKNNERGLPIGNLTSQFFANIYLNELDQFVKHTLKVKYYIRYVDDMVVLGCDPSELSIIREKIKNFLSEKLFLRLHPLRQKLLPVSDGIDFLGYIIRSSYILVRRRVVNNLRAKMRCRDIIAFEDVPRMRASIASYLGHFKWANSYQLQKRINERLEAICTSLK